MDHKVYALEGDTGSKKMEFSTNYNIWTTPAIDESGNLYITSEDYSIYSINKNGSLNWSYATLGDVFSSPSIAADGTVYFGSSDTEVYAVSKDGTLKWKFQTQGTVWSSPAISQDGTIYVGSGEKWNYGAGGYLVSRDHKLYALNSDGSLKWHYQTDGEVKSSPVIGNDGTVYVGSYDKKVCNKRLFRTFNRLTLAYAWTKPAKNGKYSKIIDPNYRGNTYWLGLLATPPMVL